MNSRSDSPLILTSKSALRPQIVALALLATLLNCRIGQATDWPAWRGPHGNGITSEPSGWNGHTWIAEEPTWTAHTAQGESSPITVGEQVFVFGWADGNDVISALNSASGETRWSQSYPSPGRGRHAVGDLNLYIEGPISTPTYDAESKLLFTLGVDGALHCWDTAHSGTKVWGFNLYDQFKAPQRPDTGGGGRDYGYTTASLVVDDLLLVEVGAPETGTLMAFDKRTGGKPLGTPVWISEHKNHAGHTGGPVLWPLEGIPAVVVMTINELLVARMDTGRTVATYPYNSRMGANVTSPSIWQTYAVLSNHFCPSNDLVQFANGQIERVADAPHTEVGIPVFHDGRVYRSSGRLECSILKDNRLEPQWEGALLGSEGTVILTGDDKLIAYGRKRLYLYTTQGELLAELRGMPGGWPHPALANGRLVIKDAKGELRCYRATAGEVR